MRTLSSNAPRMFRETKTGASWPRASRPAKECQRTLWQRLPHRVAVAGGHGAVRAWERAASGGARARCAARFEKRRNVAKSLARQASTVPMGRQPTAMSRSTARSGTGKGSLRKDVFATHHHPKKELSQTHLRPVRDASSRTRRPGFAPAHEGRCRGRQPPSPQPPPHPTPRLGRFLCQGLAAFGPDPGRDLAWARGETPQSEGDTTKELHTRRSSFGKWLA